MHRSGTSALAGVMGLLGCRMPKTLMPGARQNPKGFFESLKVYDLNDAILASGNTHWSDWRPIDNGYATEQAGTFIPQLKDVVHKEFGRSNLVALKDPRICRLGPIWLEALRDAGFTPLIVHIHRNPVEVALSLEARNGFDVRKSMLLWLRHVLEAEAATRGSRRVFISYDGLLGNWPLEVNRIQKKLGARFSQITQATRAEIEDFLDTSLRHFAATSDHTAENALLVGWFQTTFEIMQKWAQTTETAADRKTLDHIRTAFDAAAPTLCSLIEPAALKARIAELEDFKAKAGEMGAQLESQKTEVTNLMAEKQTLRKTMEVQERELGLMGAQLESQKTEVANLMAEKQTLRKTMEVQERELGLMGRMLNDTMSQVDILNSQVDQFRRGYETSRNEIKQAEAMAEEAQRRASYAEAMVSTLTASSSWKITAPLRRIATILHGKGS